ncbi:MAG: glutamine--fructose-6-phosphate transaminase (isomerizing) [Muribaculaceae bacterium]|nr:glutamine--fructose-6-phosphate transaminase (isomerizing) [Muribaculaceae bacterium]
MCGIVGYIGPRQAYEILIKGLHRLEYRGYDSAGVAVENEDGRLEVYKHRGKVSELEAYCADRDTEGTLGIAHTRWATHGEPNETNAHPHLSASRRLALVHNGTIENFAVLRDALTEQGCSFVSDTDTEVLVQLIEYVQDQTGCSLAEAVRLGLRKVVGAYAIAVIERDNPDTLITARKSSPLAIGIGEGEYFIASDASPIVEFTNKVVYLNDDEMAVIRRGEPLEVYNLDSRPADIAVRELDMSVSQLEKGGFEHFMLKEIMEQPSTIRDCIRGRVVEGRIHLNGVEENRERFRNVRRIVIAACGTSWHAALIGKRLFQELAEIPVTVEYASEFRYGKTLLGPEDMVVAVSQSGETADTLEAMRMARRSGAFVYGICNVIGSSISRAADTGTYIHVGPEIGVASTKAFTGQVTVLAMLALSVGQLRGTVSAGQVAEIADALDRMPELIEKTLALDSAVRELSLRFTFARNFLYLGRGYNFPSALEGALKLKEISYIHAEGYPAAEMKHGPIALIDSNMPVIFIAPQDELHEKIVSNIQQVKARGGTVVAIVTEGDTIIPPMVDAVLEIPAVPEPLSPVLAAIPLQLLAYHIAVNKGCDVDMPRNLAKSVTVE